MVGTLATANYVFEAKDPAGVPQNEGPSLRQCFWSPPMRGSVQHETFQLDYRQASTRRLTLLIRKRQAGGGRRVVGTLATANYVFEAKDPAGVPQNEGPSLWKCSWSPPVRGSAQHETFQLDYRQT